MARPVKDLPDGVTTMAAGSLHTCVIADGDVWCWGRYQNGQNEADLQPNDEDDGEGYFELGNALVPVRVEGLPQGARMIAAGQIHNCAAFDTGVWCWEYDKDAGDFDPTPARVKGLPQPVTALAAAGDHTCAEAGGSVWCWGDNQYGQLGNGDTTDSPVPVRVEGLPEGVTALAASFSHTCAVADGRGGSRRR